MDVNVVIVNKLQRAHHHCIEVREYSAQIWGQYDHTNNKWWRCTRIEMLTAARRFGACVLFCFYFILFYSILLNRLVDWSIGQCTQTMHLFYSKCIFKNENKKQRACTQICIWMLPIVCISPCFVCLIHAYHISILGIICIDFCAFHCFRVCCCCCSALTRSIDLSIDRLAGLLVHFCVHLCPANTIFNLSLFKISS